MLNVSIASISRPYVVCSISDSSRPQASFAVFTELEKGRGKFNLRQYGNIPHYISLLLAPDVLLVFLSLERDQKFMNQNWATAMFAYAMERAKLEERVAWALLFKLKQEKLSDSYVDLNVTQGHPIRCFSLWLHYDLMRDLTLFVRNFSQVLDRGEFHL